MKKHRLLSPKSREMAGFLICLACLFLFLYTASAKLLDHERFLKGLLKVRLISGMAVYISWLVPAAELVVALLLLLPATARRGLQAFIGLMTLFTVYITVNLIWAKHLPCHCGGAIERLSWKQHIWFNLAFIALAAIAQRRPTYSPLNSKKNEKFP